MSFFENRYFKQGKYFETKPIQNHFVISKSALFLYTTVSGTFSSSYTHVQNNNDRAMSSLVSVVK